MAKNNKTGEKELTFHNGQYRAVIGCEIKANGKRAPKVFMLTSDLRVARIKETFYRRYWNFCVIRKDDAGQPMYKRGEAVWDDYTLATAEAMIWTALNDVSLSQQRMANFNALAPAETDKPIVMQGAEKKPTTLDLTAATKLYLDKIDNDVRTKERSESNAATHRDSMSRLLRFISDRPYDPNDDKRCPRDPEKRAEYVKAKFSKPSPLSSQSIHDVLTYDRLQAFSTNVKNRDVSQYAIDTIVNTLGCADDFLGWLEEAGHWQATFVYTRLLKAKRGKLMTDEERAAKRKGVPTFTVPELVDLYKNASRMQRLWMLLGLNLCCTQQQIADLTVSHFDFTGPRPMVRFVRGKTQDTANGGYGVDAEYELWPETAAAVQEALAKRVKPVKPEHFNRAFLSEDGNELVRYNGGKSGKEKIDSIRMTWERLLRKVKAGEEGSQVRWLSFSSLRDTVSTLCRNLRSEAVQQMALAHSPKQGVTFVVMGEEDDVEQMAKGLSPKTMAGRHYTGQRDFTPLHEVMRRIHDEVFAPVWQASLEAGKDAA